jgi:bifunctional UDP-N-acetylglucosamine pyrophosphorylase / glucosamine-1-phosphate N-acetyltransferase
MVYMSGSNQEMGRRRLAIVLAAGEGIRMKSARAKVLHPVGGRSMLGHVLTNVNTMAVDAVAVVVGPNREDVAAEARKIVPAAEIFVQSERLGTAHAVLAATPLLRREFDDVVVLFADSPLVQARTMACLCEALNGETAVAVLAFEAAEPHGYGRLLLDDGALVAVREEREATDSERALTLCNAGVMALAGRHALAILSAIDNHNVRKEYYLTDALAIARARQLGTGFIVAAEDEVLGVNDRVQLATAEAVFQRRMRERVMREGATLLAPDSVFFSFDTKIGRDVQIGQNVVFGPGVVIEDGAHIEAFSHIEGAHIGRSCVVGPFARLRPGTVLAEKAKIGNFVETKAALFGTGSKLNHLSYIGDAVVGAHTNIGAGTITCNYDGFIKHKTIIAENAFIGSNTALVAPVTIGAGAYVGSGSVVTEDVPADALALARGRQVNKADWAKSFRQRRTAAKNSKK